MTTSQQAYKLRANVTSINTAKNRQISNTYFRIHKTILGNTFQSIEMKKFFSDFDILLEIFNK